MCLCQWNCRRNGARSLLRLESSTVPPPRVALERSVSTSPSGRQTRNQAAKWQDFPSCNSFSGCQAIQKEMYQMRQTTQWHSRNWLHLRHLFFNSPPLDANYSDGRNNVPNSHSPLMDPLARDFVCHSFRPAQSSDHLHHRQRYHLETVKVHHPNSRAFA